MHLRRSSERAGSRHDTQSIWDELPTAPAAGVVIKAPRAGDLVAPAAPVRAA